MTTRATSSPARGVPARIRRRLALVLVLAALPLAGSAASFVVVGYSVARDAAAVAGNAAAGGSVAGRGTTRDNGAAFVAPIARASGGGDGGASPPPAAVDAATLRFLEARVKDDPLDFAAHNRLAGLDVRLLRDTGDFAWLDRAAAEADASLAAVPEDHNPAGLAARSVVDFENHRFAEARDEAKRAYAIDPRLDSALATAGDAELELGNVDEASRIYDDLATREQGGPLLARQARLAELCGDDARALDLLRRAGTGDGWYAIRRGEIELRTGHPDLAAAEYASAPDTFAKLDHVAELAAAEGRYDEAIALYRALIDRVPRAEILQALGDLYAFTGRRGDARAWHEKARDAYLRSVSAGNAHYFHHLSGYYADSEPDPAEALRWARRDLEVRRSIFAWDTLAWALYKHGDFAAAADAMTRALATGSRDAHLLQHAGLVYSRAGDLGKGRGYLELASAVDPACNAFHVHR